MPRGRHCNLQNGRPLFTRGAQYRSREDQQETLPSPALVAPYIQIKIFLLTPSYPTKAGSDLSDFEAMYLYFFLKA
jgi:hypothetical protein